MKLKTGYKSIPIEFDNGEKTSISFNPSDPSLMARLKDFKEKMEEKAGLLDDIPLDESGQPINIEFYDKFIEMQTYLFEQLDVAFGSSISKEVFKYCSPFAIVGGEFFIEQFVSAIIPEIEKHLKKANAEAEKRMSKHIGKYQK